MGNNENKILKFPEDKTHRVLVQEKTFQKKSVLVFSLFAVMMMSVVANQFMNTSDKMSNQGRGIASFNQSLDGRGDIKWEHQLANELSQMKDLKATFAERPSLQEELIYGQLGGKYKTTVHNGLLKSIEASGEESVNLMARETFLKKYTAAFAVKFDDVELASRSGQSEDWILKSQGQEVGRAHFEFNAEGHLRSLELQ